MIINFITALAWIWGALLACCAALNALSLPSPEPREIELRRFRRAATIGSPAWAWLIARYLLS